MRHSRPDNIPEEIRVSLVSLLVNFKDELTRPNLRAKVKALVPVFYKLRDLGCSLIPKAEAVSARDRILAYFKRYPQTVINGEELMVVSGIAEWARRLRELRVQFGWAICSGVTFQQMAEDAEEAGDTVAMSMIESVLGINPSNLKPDQYVLLRAEQDRRAAHRWHILNDVRRTQASVSAKILAYFRKNVGEEISGEELKYLAKDKNEWTRRVRELRTEQGWPIVTRNSGRKDLAIGIYVLEEDRQTEEHDRKIPDPVRVAVLERDDFKCVKCGWNRQMIVNDDPRKMLELHHVKHHKNKGENTVENLVTLCNVCHDEKHRGKQERNYHPLELSTKEHS